MVRIGIVGGSRILNAHLQGFAQLRAAGVDDFRITALTARVRDDALMFRQRGAGPPPRPPVMDPATGDPLAAPHTYVSDFQPDVLPEVYTDYRAMIADGAQIGFADALPNFVRVQELDAFEEEDDEDEEGEEDEDEDEA